MKKFFSFLCAAVLAVGAQAQLVTSRSVSAISAPKEPGRTTWMVRLGVGSNGMVYSDADEGPDAKVGYFLGFEFNKSIRQRSAYWGMDFALASRGWKISKGGYEQKLAAHNIHWSPFIFGWKIAIPDTRFSIDPHIGTYLAVDYAGKYTGEYDGQDLDDVKIGDAEGYSRFDGGLKVGVGVWYAKRYNLDLTYQRGFLTDNEDADGGTSNFWVRLGYAF